MIREGAKMWTPQRKITFMMKRDIFSWRGHCRPGIRTELGDKAAARFEVVAGGGGGGGFGPLRPGENQKNERTKNE